jgi:hypothetical protein
MHFPRASKTLFIILHYAMSTLVARTSAEVSFGLGTRHEIVASSESLFSTSALGSISLWPNLFSRQNNGVSSVTSVNPFPKLPADVSQNNGPSCERCRKKCAKRFMKDPDNCRRCVRCPKGQKGNSDSTQCIDENDGNRKRPDPEDKERRYQSKKRMESKKRNYPAQKDRKKNEWNYRENKRIDNENRKKTRFMGRCLTIVPLASMIQPLCICVQDLFQG